MTLLVYDFEFNLLAAERRVISAASRVYYNGFGTFEVHIPSSSKIFELVLKNKYLIMSYGEKTAVVIGYDLSDELIIYGRTPEWLFTKRVIAPYEKTLSPCDICREFAREAFKDVDSFLLGETVECDEVTEKNEMLSTLYECVSSVLKKRGLGWSFVFDVRNKNWIFNIFKGRDSGLILAEGHKNAYDTRISEDILDMATDGVYLKDGVKYVLSGDKTGIYRMEEIVRADNEEDAQTDFSQFAIRSSTKAYVNDNVDIMLGDIVKIKLVRGDNRVTMKKRIWGIDTRISDGVKTVMPIFEDE